MSTQTPTAQKSSKEEISKKREVIPPAIQTSSVPQVGLAAIYLRRAVADPRSARPPEILALQRRYGNEAVQRLLASHNLQAKLTVGAANDSYEQEADRVAAEVMSMPAQAPAIQRQGEEEEEIQTKPLAATITPMIQRQPLAEEEEEPLQGKFIQRQSLEEEEEPLQGKFIPGRETFTPGTDFESRLAATRAGGSPLPKPTRDFMEQRFGADFSGVRLHTGSESAQLNREVSSRAFTRGQDVYLGEGKEAVESSEGKRLLAHELTHVVQQTGNVVRHTFRPAPAAPISRTSPPAQRVATGVIQRAINFVGDVPARIREAFNDENMTRDAADAKLRELNLEHEVAVLHGADGKIKAVIKGAAAQVSNEDIDAALHSAEGTTIPYATHNHPSGSPLTVSDIIMAFRRGLKEVRAVGATHTFRCWQTVDPPKKYTKSFEIFDKIQGPYGNGERSWPSEAGVQGQYTVKPDSQDRYTGATFAEDGAMGKLYGLKGIDDAGKPIKTNFNEVQAEYTAERLRRYESPAARKARERANRDAPRGVPSVPTMKTSVAPEPVREQATSSISTAASAAALSPSTKASQPAVPAATSQQSTPVVPVASALVSTIPTSASTVPAYSPDQLAAVKEANQWMSEQDIEYDKAFVNQIRRR